MTATTDQWMMMQFYDQPSPDYDHNLFDQVSAMEGLISDVNNTVSSSLSPTSPKAVNNNGSRPIRRRSRASKRTPTTLLNANTTNFRALVQQFTGCPSSTAMSFDVYKGPITLNFKQGSQQVIQHHHNKSRTTVTTVSPAAAAVKASSGNTGFNSEGGHHLHQYQYQQQQQQLADQQQQWRLQDHQQQQQQSVDDNLFDDNSDLFSCSINSSSISDGLIMDHDYSLQDLTNNAFFSSNNDVIQNDAYYM
ncbi:hypothetical protein K1719_002273 [Acacia pycnantha]|nr:hypothetical protein K1719_002273 [Acacia pycnantha]